MQTLTLLGATGSIGQNTLAVVDHLGNRFRVAGLSGHGNVVQLAQDAARHWPCAVCVTEAASAEEYHARLRELGHTHVGSSDAPFFLGETGLIELVQHTRSDIVVGAVMGAAGLRANLTALEQSARLALANKESLVMAGQLFMATAAAHGGEIIPIDSEHCALFQLLQGIPGREVASLILTASGGPFRDWPEDDFKRITVADALQHPTWQMGRKITVDSATMMNKALEIIEARWLFDVPESRVEVAVHPQSIVHSLVRFVDGGLTAQLSKPDMKLPIQYALTHPERSPSPAAATSIAELSGLTFAPADEAKFPALRLGRTAIRQGGTLPAVFNAANEIAVHRFLAEEIPFVGISALVEAVMSEHEIVPEPDLPTIQAADLWAREKARLWRGQDA